MSLGGELMEPVQAEAFWAGLREQRHAFFADAASLWRLSLPPAASAVVLRGEQLIEWGGAQRWLKVENDVDPDADAEAQANLVAAVAIRRTVAAAGGHATLFRGGDKRVGVFHPLAPAVAKIHQRLKAAFDPCDVFNRGRMYDVPSIMQI
jgi:glycolate oxidase FAD binding subunit